MQLASYDAEAIAASAIEANDKNGDGQLSKDELSNVQSLLSALERLDRNQDGLLDANEIVERIRAWEAYGAGLTKTVCTLVRGGRPVQQATVIYEPESFMLGVVHEASGVTGGTGEATVSVEEEYRPNPRILGMQPGFYRVRARFASGEETDMNAGFEVAGDLLNNHRVGR